LAACKAPAVCASAGQQAVANARLKAARRPGVFFKGGDNRRKTIMEIS
jgi:hypothetical protein